MPEASLREAAAAARFFPVIARSSCDEAIHLARTQKMDCFAALAMTGKHFISLAAFSVRLSGRGEKTG
jgi:hypothetical protein